MVAPTVTVLSPPPQNYPDPGVLRPRSLVRWTGGTGPFDVLHEWDTVVSFDSGALLQDTNVGATSEDEGVPPADLGPLGVGWFYRVTVTDTSDAAFTTTAALTLAWYDPDAQRRYLHQLLDLGVGFTPFDDPAGGWGPDPAAVGPDGANIGFRRYLHQLLDLGVGFDPTDTPVGGWGPADGAGPADGFTIAFRRYLHLLAGDVDTSTPTPHIWYVYPSFGREGWEFRIIGFGFGDTQGTYSGTVTLNALAVSVIGWALIAEEDPDLIINGVADIAQPVHQEITATVPLGASSGLVVVCTDGP
jgi:hypothetical protein